VPKLMCDGATCESINKEELEAILITSKCIQHQRNTSKKDNGSEATKQVGRSTSFGRNLSWSWRLLVKCHRSWSSSIKDYIRTEEFLCVFLSSGDVLALDDCLYLVASCLTILYDLVVL